MLRLPLRELEDALKNPIVYRRKMEETSNGEFWPSYFGALRDATGKYHKWNGDAVRAIAYLEKRLERFSDQKRRADTIDHFMWYVDEYSNRGWPMFQTRLNVEVSLPVWAPANLICSGQVSRLDIVPTGGYAAWLMRIREPEGWFNELRMPLLQGALACNVLQVPVNEISIGIYSFEERFVALRCFTQSEISQAHAILGDLFRQMGY